MNTANKISTECYFYFYRIKELLITEEMRMRFKKQIDCIKSIVYLNSKCRISNKVDAVKYPQTKI